MAMTIVVMQACNLPTTQEQTPEPEIDPVIAAQLTLTAAAEQNPLVEPSATFTALPTLSPTAELTSTPAFTSTPTFAYVTLSEATNCRVGPSTAYNIVDTFQVGQTIEVTGKHPFDNYWYVRSPNNAAVYCWMWGFYATGGNLNNVPIVTPPPTFTPAPQPEFSASYENSGKCISWWTRINLNNTGPIAFKSMSISITDTVTDETRNDSDNGFQDVNACVLSAVTPSLGPGDSHTIVAPSLSADPTGHEVTVTIKLCTENGQGGTCASKTIEFTP